MARQFIVNYAVHELAQRSIDAASSNNAIAVDSVDQVHEFLQELGCDVVLKEINPNYID